MGAGPASALAPRRPLLHGRRHLVHFGTTEALCRMGEGASSSWGPQRYPGMGVGASYALGHPRPPPHGRGGLFRFGTTEACAAWAWGPLPRRDHRDPRHMGVGGASSALGPLSPPPHGRGGLLRFGTTEAPPHGRGHLVRFGTTQAPAAWAWALLPLCDHRGPRRMGLATHGLGPRRPPPHHLRGGSSALRPPRPLPHGRRSLLRFGTTEPTLPA